MLPPLHLLLRLLPRLHLLLRVARLLRRLLRLLRERSRDAPVIALVDHPSMELGVIAVRGEFAQTLGVGRTSRS